ncbi:SusD/RagB family nutrient-binding outer membrane lipoprotein [Marinilabilia sp.]
MKSIYKILFALVFVFAWGCDKDEFAELNSDPAKLQEGELRFSITKAVEQMYENDYTTWFYNNFDYIYPWSQFTTQQGGNSPTFNVMESYGTQYIYRELFPQTRDVQYAIEAMPEAEKARHQVLKALTYPIQILPAMANSDLLGSIIFSEAGRAPFTNPPLITPAYDSQEELYNLWLTQLDEAIDIFTNSENPIQMGNQDVIYGGDYAKWAKFCNLLKLKVAARMINVDRARALSVAEEVANSPAGFMDALTDDFIYNRGVKYYGTGNGFWIGYGNQVLIDFLRDNGDPRLKFLFKKNDFNAEVVQAFIDAGVDLPPYVEQYVSLDGDGNFAGWTGPGEPWVRYHGAPLAPDATLDSDNDIYFNQGTLYRVNLNGAEKTYSATSLFSEKLVRTTYDYTYPTKPGGRVIELKDNDPPLHVILGSSAETNLYLAEFKLLGANIPGTAQEYLNRGVELSVRRIDALAENNQFPYYSNDPVYTDPVESEQASTKLKEGEIANLLSQPALDLSAGDALEKVYIQQYLNFASTPNDLWTLVRRSGIPKRNSAILPWQEFISSGTEETLPRRFVIGAPTEDDLLYQNKVQALEDQGFTPSVSSPEILNSERMWFDENNPDYGAGPIE